MKQHYTVFMVAFSRASAPHTSLHNSIPGKEEEISIKMKIIMEHFENGQYLKQSRSLKIVGSMPVMVNIKLVVLKPTLTFT